MEMSPLITTSFFFSIFFSISFAQPTSSSSSPCSIRFRIFSNQNNMSNCRKLATLDAELAWQLITTTTRQNGLSHFHVIFAAALADDVAWVAWGVNPHHPQMSGTRAMIGVRHPDTGMFQVDTYNVTSDTRKGCGLLPGTLDDDDVEFGNRSMEYVDGYLYAMRATVGLPSGLNHVWQVGYAAQGMEPRIHPVSNLQHFDCAETLDLKTGTVHRHAGHHRLYLRNVHGILSIIGWGTILPVGGMIARYSRFPLEVEYSRWFFAHRCSQFLGYTLGAAAWVLGIFLGNSTNLYVMKTHRLYAHFIFAFATLQVTALFFKPGKGDEYRKYWNLYHHFLGYGLLTVIIINMFKGIAILKPNYTWKWAYIGILACLAALALAMEIWSWIKFLNIRSQNMKNKRPPNPHFNNNISGINNPWRSTSITVGHPQDSIEEELDSVTLS